MTDSPQTFRSLVHNAFNFLNTSIGEVENRPKYSVINFCAAVELFLKARLFLEHWTLILEDPKNASKTKFISGDFKSVGMGQAIDRLKNIANETINHNAQNSFNQLREHRNKLIHFHNPKYVKKLGQVVLEEVVAEQCEAWFYLHYLLSKQWREEFKDFQDEVEHSYELMLKHRLFLKVKYDQIQDDLNKGKARGINFSWCLFCGFDTGREIEAIEPLSTNECLVCERRYNSIPTRCPYCQEKIVLFGLDDHTCSHCLSELGPDFFFDLFIGNLSAKESQSETKYAYCANCKFTSFPTVVPHNENWVCLSCLEVHPKYDVGICGWCKEFVTGEIGDYWTPGCVMCVYHLDNDLA